MKQSSMLTVICVAIALTLTACLSPHNAAMFVKPHVYGPYSSSLTKEDVRQIIELSYTRQDIRKPVYDIYSDALDHADVGSGPAQNSRDPVTGFKVRKTKSGWIIIRGSVYQTEVFITS
jgi:hypothetical protein